MNIILVTYSVYNTQPIFDSDMQLRGRTEHPLQRWLKITEEKEGTGELCVILTQSITWPL